MAWSTPSTQITGYLVVAADWNVIVNDLIALTPAGFVYVCDGAGAAITTGIKVDIEIFFKCDLARITLLPDVSGSITWDVWKDTYANFPPTVADTIIGGGGTKPLISATTKAQQTTFAGYTTAWADGDILRLNVDSCTTITRCSFCCKVTRS
jgi:hypothetical protein